MCEAKRDSRQKRREKETREQKKEVHIHNYLMQAIYVPVYEQAMARTGRTNVSSGTVRSVNQRIPPMRGKEGGRGESVGEGREGGRRGGERR